MLRDDMRDFSLFLLEREKERAAKKMKKWKIVYKKR